MNLKRVELYFMLIDIVKSLKITVETKREITGLEKVEKGLTKLVLAEQIKK